MTDVVHSKNTLTLILLYRQRQKKFSSRSQVVVDEGVNEHWQVAYWSVEESTSSVNSSWSQEVAGRLGSKWALITAPDNNSCRLQKFVGRSGSHWALIRAPDHTSLVLDWESVSSNNSSRSQKFVGRSGNQWTLRRAPDSKVLWSIGE